MADGRIPGASGDGQLDLGRSVLEHQDESEAGRPGVLLIDDDDSVRTTLRLTLEHFGHTVIEARNGTEGLELFQQAAADLVITDIVMPEKEGFEVLRTLLNRTQTRSNRPRE